MKNTQNTSVTFSEDWYSDEQCKLLASVVKSVEGLPGDLVEIGCWEGKSTVSLANACYPAILFAVDTWQGNLDEAPDHSTIAKARERDIFQTFKNNIAASTKGNVRPQQMRSTDFLAGHQGQIKLCHIDACHDYQSVKNEIKGALKLLVKGGVLCGDDFMSAHRNRKDLQGGVERAVRELLPGFKYQGNFWWWKNTSYSWWTKFTTRFPRLVRA